VVLGTVVYLIPCFLLPITVVRDLALHCRRFLVCWR